MRRRHFIAGLICSVPAWPAIGRAQAPPVPTIGFLGAASISDWSSWTEAFIARLHELGWVEGQTIRIEYRWAAGQSSKYAEFARELVRLKADVIVTSGAAGTAARQETAVIPIVLAVSNDPVGDGLIESLSRPGGNVTGLSVQATDSASKRLELLREVVPNLRDVAILANLAYPASLREMNEVEAAARTFSLKTVDLKIQRAEDIAPYLDTLKDQADALYVCTDPLLNALRGAISKLATDLRLPTMWGFRQAAEAGALVSYGANFPALFRRAGDYVDKILRGAKPSDIPVEQPVKFDLVINLKTAKVLGISIPPMLLARADEVIE